MQSSENVKVQKKVLWRTLIVGAACLTALGTAGAGEYASGTYTNQAGSRDYNVWIPTGYDGNPRPAVVLLHGCVVNAEDTASGSRFNELADRKGFFVIYPKESTADNANGCWNFSKSVNQTRDSGEPSIIAGITQSVQAQYNIDLKRTYVGGISAGGLMTAIMAACYPDLYAGAAILSGSMYKAATNLLDTYLGMVFGSVYSPEYRGWEAWQCGGKRSDRMPTLVMHGTDDTTVNVNNAELAIRQAIATNDWADDATDNDSAAYTLGKRETFTVPNGHTYDVDTYYYKNAVLAQKYVIQGMGHAWSGGDTTFPYTDDKGPDATRIMYDFFSVYSKP